MRLLSSRLAAVAAVLTSSVMLASNVAWAQPAQPPSPQFELPGSADVYSDTVGATPGDFRVDEGGAASYSIPIATLPGTAGLTPKLSLDYSARGPSGLLGPGFRLGGSSAIQRCRTSVEAGDGPGPHAGIDFQNDRYENGAASCIDGERMFRAPGANNAEDLRCRNEISAQSQNIEVAHAFRVELDPATRICGYVRKASPNYDFWLVYPKDGSLRRYGYAPGASLRAYDDSLQSASIGYLVQSLDRIADPSGNTVDFSYSVDAPVGEQLLTEVRYTGRVGNRLDMDAGYLRPPYARTVLVYETLPAGAGRVDYLGGSRLELRKQLARIELYGPRNHGPNPDQEVQAKRYILGYAQATSGSRVSRLVEVRECSGDGSTCYPPTRFAWNNVVDSDFPEGLNAPSALSDSSVQLSIAADFKVGDINGDGRQDLVFLKDRNCAAAGTEEQTSAQDPQRFRLMVAVSTGSGLASPVPTEVFLSRKPRDGGGLRYEYSSCQNNQAAAVHLKRFQGAATIPVELPLAWGLSWHLYDLSGDGRDDLIAFRQKSLSDGPGFGLFFHRTSKNSTNQWRFGTDAVDVTDLQRDSSEVRDSNFADFTGDGLPDLMIGSLVGASVLALERVPVGTSNPMAFRFEQNLRPVTLLGFEEEAILSFGFPFRGNYANLGDLDGDGVQDLTLGVLRLRGTGYNCANNTCVACGGAGQPPCDNPHAACTAPGQGCIPNSPPTVGERTAHRWQTVTDAAGERADAVTLGALEAVRYFVTVRTVVTSDGSLTLTAEQCVGPGSSPNQCQNDATLLGAGFADINGDGLADLWLTRQHAASTGQNPVDEFHYRLNRGGGLQRYAPSISSGFALHQAFSGHLQLSDMTGDRRADLVYVCQRGSNAVGKSCSFGAGQNEGDFPLRLRSFDGTSFAGDRPAASGSLMTLGGQNPQEYLALPIDLNGDGSTDLLRYRTNASVSQNTYLMNGRMKFGGNDYVVKFSSGLGAVHEVSYAPMVSRFVYERIYNSPRQNFGRGSPVFDVFAPLWVVSEARSTSPGCPASEPTCQAGSTQAVIRYAYHGARMQAGGRGFLGFSAIRTEDVQNALLTTTEYRQDFPYIGRPSHTIVQRLSENLPNLCIIDPLLPGCFEEPPDNCNGGICPEPPRLSAVRGANPTPQRFMSLGDPTVSDLSTSYQSLPAFDPGQRRPLAVSPWQSDERRHDPVTQALVQQVQTQIAIDAMGNVTLTSAVTKNGSGQIQESSASVHAFGCTQVPVQVRKNSAEGCEGPIDPEWVRLGRLSLTGTLTTRAGQTVVRRAAFEYDPSRLLLIAEVSGLYVAGGLHDPPASEFPHLHKRTDHELDANGNRTLSVSCSVSHYSNRQACLNLSGFQQRQWPNEPTRFQRYQRTEYDALGRFAQATKSPYYASGTPAGIEQYDGRSGLMIDGAIDRNVFGDPLSVIDARGVVTQQAYGALGRPWFTADATGSFSRSNYRWCLDAVVPAALTGQPGIPVAAPRANCPVGAVYRIESNASIGNLNQTHIAPRAFSYHDALGREILRTARSYQQQSEDSDSNRRWSSSYTRYDVLGRVRVQSEPYFSVDPLAAQTPTSRAGSLAPNVDSPKETLTSYDVYGRSDRVDSPSDVGNAAASTTASFTGLTTTTTDPRGKSQSIEKNALSEQVRATDQGGFFVSYTHGAHGNLHKISRTPTDGDSANALIETVITHDLLGRAKSVQDPDRGLTSFVYNALGEILESTDAKGQKTRFEYDALGRLVARHEQRVDEFGQLVPEQTSRWEYDTATGGSGVATGLLKEEKNSLSMLTGLGGYLKEVSYDAFGRPIKVRTQIEGMNYWQRQTYDEYGRPFQIFAAATSETAAAGLLMQYSADGFPIREREAANGTTGQIYREALSTDARGQVRKERYHDTNSLLVVREYDANTGRLRSITSGPNGLLQKWNFKYDLNGNLQERHNQAGAAGNSVDLKEIFGYDDLNRLKTVDASVANGASFRAMTLQYDQIGNIISKTGSINPGTMNYRQPIAGCGMAGPHALSRAGNRDYCYDANGNATEIRDGGDAIRISYTGYDRVRSITSRFGPGGVAGDSERFFYAPDRSLIKRTVDFSEAEIEQIIYVGDVEFRNGKRIRHIGGYLSIAEIAGNPTPRYDYLLKDHLGSVEVIASETGALRSRRSFDAHGMRRALQPVGTAWVPLSTVATLDLADEPVTEGFGGHRQLDRFGLVHMGARLYDPYTGRFLQADVYTEPEATQGLNRYSFVVNNPLTHTDPTGNLSFRQALGIVVGVAFAIISQQYWAADKLIASFLTASAGGFASAAISTGSLRSGLWGAVSAAAFWGIGTHFSSVARESVSTSVGPGHIVRRVASGSRISKVAAHAVTGGTLSHLQGGKFGHGFASAGFTQALSPVVGQIEGSSFGAVLARTTASAVIGGTASKMTGGSFSSGAQTGAFSSLFNDTVHADEPSYWDAFDEQAAEFFSGLTYHADNAVDYWVDQGGILGAVGGTLAGTVSSANIGNTVRQASLGAVSGSAGLLGRVLFQVRGGRHIFFSGGVENMTLASAAARGSHGLIEQTIGGRFLISYDNYLGPLRSGLWNFGSFMYAANTRSAITYVQGYRIGGTWQRFEAPVIKLYERFPAMRVPVERR